MIENENGLSSTAKLFYKFLKDKSPFLLEIAEVVEASEKRPYIEEPGTIVIEIPARTGFIFEKLYVETRKEDILIELGTLTHYHYSFYSDKEIELRMPRAIQFIQDILDEKIVLVKNVERWSKKERIDVINLQEISKVKNVLRVYSWKGTYDSKTS